MSPNATVCAGDLQLATPVTERSTRHVEGGALQPEPPITPVRPPLRSFPLQLWLQPRGSALSSLACVPSWQYLRVREIVEEEGRELFIQQRAAVVPRHLPAAAAACGGVSAEPARGRERASERASERGGGRRLPGGRVEGGARAPGCGRRAGCGGGAARAWGRTPGFSCSESGAETRSRSPPQGKKKAPAARWRCPGQQPGACAAMRAPPPYC